MRGDGVVAFEQSASSDSLTDCATVEEALHLDEVRRLAQNGGGELAGVGPANPRNWRVSLPSGKNRAVDASHRRRVYPLATASDAADRYFEVQRSALVAPERLQQSIFEGPWAPLHVHCEAVVCPANDWR